MCFVFIAKFNFIRSTSKGSFSTLLIRKSIAESSIAGTMHFVTIVFIICTGSALFSGIQKFAFQMIFDSTDVTKFDLVRNSWSRITCSGCIFSGCLQGNTAIISITGGACNTKKCSSGNTVTVNWDIRLIPTLQKTLKTLGQKIPVYVFHTLSSASHAHCEHALTGTGRVDVDTTSKR